jgi:hypothetical protein
VHEKYYCPISVLSVVFQGLLPGSNFNCQGVGPESRSRNYTPGRWYWGSLSIWIIVSSVKKIVLKYWLVGPVSSQSRVEVLAGQIAKKQSHAWAAGVLEAVLTRL